MCERWSFLLVISKWNRFSICLMTMMTSLLVNVLFYGKKNFVFLRERIECGLLVCNTKQFSNCNNLFMIGS